MLISRIVSISERTLLVFLFFHNRRACFVVDFRSTINPPVGVLVRLCRLYDILFTGGTYRHTILRLIRM